MFLNRKILARLIKQTYKTGLKLALDDGWLYMAGSFWECSTKLEFVPKEIRGEIIGLIGCLPEEGQKWECSPCGIQNEIMFGTDLEAYLYENGPLKATDTLQIGSSGTLLRFMQDEDTGKLFLINNVFICLVDNESIDSKNGETNVDEPLYYYNSVMWQNNVCKLRAWFRDDPKNAYVMEAMKGVNLLPEVEA